MNDSNIAKYPGISYFESLPKWTGNGKFSLESITSLLHIFDNPQDKVKSIVIGGTNGKGSVAATVSSILGASGAQVGLSISPHLSRINERIVINGLEVDDQTLSGLGEQIKKVSRDNKIIISFHEAITAAAFLLFAQKNLDWIVMEVGLGGRLDSVNVIKNPTICSIVTVDYDHEKILGNTLAKIAYEKAGILRKGTELVLGPMSLEAEQVIFSEAKNKDISPIYFDRDFRSKWKENSFSHIEYEDKKGSKITLNPFLKGRYQSINIGIAVTIAKILDIDPEDIKNGVKNVFWPGRLEIFNFNGREIIIDCAHNPAGMFELTNYLKARDINSIEVVFGALQSKNWKQMLDILKPFIGFWNIMKPDSQDAVSSVDIVDYLGVNENSIEILEGDYNSFLNKISSNRNPLLITGSIYLIGRLRGYLVPQNKPVWIQKIFK